jgi:diadenosine tetraphosphate (Ap4A) HIT family hydrolase
VQRVVQGLRKAGALPLAGVGQLEAQKLSHSLEALLSAALREREGYPDAAPRVLVDVPHAHVHLIPLNEMDEMRFQNKVSLTPEEFTALAQAIQANL